MLYLYLISQTVNNNYDTYDSAVVCAASIEDAAKMHPKVINWNGSKTKSWCESDEVIVECIGVAEAEIQEGSVICSSYNAG